MSKIEEILEYINAIRIISGTSTEDEMQTIKMLVSKAHNELYDYMLLMKEKKMDMFAINKYKRKPVTDVSIKVYLNGRFLPKPQDIQSSYGGQGNRAKSFIACTG